MRNLHHIPVTPEHLAVLRAAGEPVAAVYAGFAVTSVVLDDGQKLDYYWRHDGIAPMGACDLGRAAEMEPQTVMFMGLPTFDAYCADHPRS